MNRGSRDYKRAARHRKEQLVREGACCCWCGESFDPERPGPGGQPQARTATLEHLRSRLHEKSRSPLRNTRVSHHECNTRVNRIESFATAGRPQRESDIRWLREVVDLRAPAADDPLLRQAIDWLLALVTAVA